MEQLFEMAFTEGLGGALQEAAREGAPMGELCCLPLSLGYGPLEEDVFGPKRLETLEGLYAAHPEGKDAAREQLNGAQASWKRLLERLEPGDSLRCWVSDNPDEACGLCWLLSQLPRDLQIHLQVLPPYLQQGDYLVQYRSWEELEPAFLAEQQLPPPVPRLFPMSAGGLWQRLCQENAPLRGFVGSRLCSLPLDYYDHFLLRRALELGSSFSQAQLVGLSLGKDQLPVQEGWLNLRVQALLEQGYLHVLKAAPDPYHRLLERGKRL